MSLITPKSRAAALPGLVLAGLCLSFLSACGGSELTCGAGTVLKDGACVPAAKGRTCGAGTTLVDGKCVPDATDGGGSCVPSCGLRTCGDDGCGGSCGACTNPALPICNTYVGQCVGECVPECSGRNCGDDGCGGTCGSCSEGSACAANGRCIPAAWTCDATWYGAGDACDCDCGMKDPDCDDPGAPLARCEAFQTCNGEGKCVSSVPAAWTCLPSAYGTLDACNCNCGAPDPDCSQTSLTLLGCGAGVTTCNADGTCGTCTPDCTGKQCGSDGCDGLCGSCDHPTLSACQQGTCVNPCSPRAIKCDYATCGDDDCGGSCGTCALGMHCSDGRCERDTVQENPASCVGHCGSRAPAGCYCTETCAQNGLCCQDYEAACHCEPDCTGKECGDDGCNGTCGVCNDPVKKFCGADQKCTSACTPKCDGRSCGDDGCGGTCGTCASGQTCTFLGQCVPSGWQCNPLLFGDGRGCDCGCGAADPDCDVSDAAVFNCPTSRTKCKADGLCDVTICAADTACGAGQWCTGVYSAGGAKFGGVCEAPTSSAKPTGFTCEIDDECASLACLDGLCRRYCQRDAECPSSQICVGLPVRDPVTGILRGTAPVCEQLGSGRACTSQASCAAGGEACVAVVDPVTRGPRHVCAIAPATSAVGQSCLSDACPDGYLCSKVGTRHFCTLPCPAGDADCPNGYSCGSVPFTIAGTSNPPSLPACVPR